MDAGTSWHTYRLEVRGVDYRLYVDGKQMVEYTIYDHQAPTHAGIFSTLQSVHVRNFSVTALSGAAPTPLPKIPYASLVVQPTDLPNTLFGVPDEQHVFTDAQSAVRNGTALSDVEASGQIATYGVDYLLYGTGLADIFSEVIAFRTGEQATAALPGILTRVSTAVAQDHGTNVHSLPISGGEASSGLAFEVSVTGIPTDYLVFHVLQGRYIEELFLVTDPAIFSENDTLSIGQRYVSTLAERLRSAP
jgi:hypothetical protein